jgi:hypothetical protein
MVKLRAILLPLSLEKQLTEKCKWIGKERNVREGRCSKEKAQASTGYHPSSQISL